MVVVAGAHHDLPPGEHPAEILEEWPRGGHRVARRTVAQLEYVAEQHQTVDVLQGLQQRRAWLGAAQHVGTRAAAEMQVGDDQRAHLADRTRRGDDRRAQEAPTTPSGRGAPATASRTCLGSMKRTSSRTASTSEMSSTPRARKKPTSSRTRFSGALAPEEIPTTRLSRSHSSRTSLALSIRWASVPQSRATSTSRTEFDELREPITSIRSQLPASCLTAVWRLVVA